MRRAHPIRHLNIPPRTKFVVRSLEAEDRVLLMSEMITTCRAVAHSREHDAITDGQLN